MTNSAKTVIKGTPKRKLGPCPRCGTPLQYKLSSRFCPVCHATPVAEYGDVEERSCYHCKFFFARRPQRIGEMVVPRCWRPAGPLPGSDPTKKTCSQWSDRNV